MYKMLFLIMAPNTSTVLRKTTFVLDNGDSPGWRVWAQQVASFGTFAVAQCDQSHIQGDHIVFECWFYHFLVLELQQIM